MNLAYCNRRYGTKGTSVITDLKVAADLTMRAQAEIAKGEGADTALVDRLGTEVGERAKSMGQKLDELKSESPEQFNNLNHDLMGGEEGMESIATKENPEAQAETNPVTNAETAPDLSTDNSSNLADGRRNEQLVAEEFLRHNVDYGQIKVGENGKIVRDANTGPLFNMAGEILDRARVVYPKVEQTFGSMAERYGISLDLGSVDGVKLGNPSMKSLSSMADRLYRNGTEGKGLSMDLPKDPIRGTFIFPSEQSIANLSNILGEFGDSIVRLDVKKNPDYRGIHLNLRIDGVNVEIQLHTPDSWALKLEGDQFYEKWRSLDEKRLTAGQRYQKLTERNELKGKWNQLLADSRLFSSLTASASESVTNTGLSSSQSNASSRPSTGFLSGPQDSVSTSHSLVEEGKHSSNRLDLVSSYSLRSGISDSSSETNYSTLDTQSPDHQTDTQQTKTGDYDYVKPPLRDRTNWDVTNEALARNDYVLSQAGAERIFKPVYDAIREVDPKARLIIDGEGTRKAAKRLFQLVNKAGVSEDEVIFGAWGMVERAEVKWSDGKTMPMGELMSREEIVSDLRTNLVLYLTDAKLTPAAKLSRLLTETQEACARKIETMRSTIAAMKAMQHSASKTQAYLKVGKAIDGDAAKAYQGFMQIAQSFPYFKRLVNGHLWETLSIGAGRIETWCDRPL